MICLDLDGVVTDGINECLIVSWVAWNRETMPDNPMDIIDRIPADFIEIFKIARNYVRHDGHFIVPYIIDDVDGIELIANQDNFNNVFSSIDSNLVDQFSISFRETRKALRNDYPEIWYDLHRIYPGISELFELADELYIVSGKDSESIYAICGKNNITIDKSRIYGGLKSKKEVLDLLLLEAKGNNKNMIFCDDNLPNVIESDQLGIQSFWAGWGYKTEEHEEIAKQMNIKPVTISTLVSVSRSANQEFNN